MAPNRRTLLHAGVSVTATLASATLAGQSGARDPQPPKFLLADDSESCAAAAQDFGHIVQRRPRAICKPATSGEVVDILRWAREQGLKVAARGQGHATYGRAMAEDGIVMDLGALAAIHRIEPDRVVVDAGATWHDVLDATLAKGLTPPVLTNYLGLSVGGTLAVGGIGGSSSRHGLQTDQVLELDVVTGEGVELTCSPTAHAELFDAVRAGLSQCAIITRATLRLMRAPERVRRYLLSYPDLASLTADQRRALDERRFDQLQGAVVPDSAGGWRYQLEAGVFYDSNTPPDDKVLLAGLADKRETVSDLGFGEDANAFAKLEKLLRSNGQWFNPHPWLLTYLRGSNALEVASEVIAELNSDDLGPFGRITYYPMFKDACRTPLLRLPDERVVVPFNLIRIPVTAYKANADRQVVRNRTLYDRIREAGGILYPVSALAMSSQDWADHFGARWPLLRDARRRHDPDGILTPGYDLF
ncbi:FAD-binding protein [Bradyrhizobium arachidis]|uniref:FAD-binding protein n=1 Tax=Bradyrhizobium arachidis TaxID=858423 RepID=A0AAE7TKW0_9BRAD|nr:FAD-binding protein [Bradyrhizobium arachidis]QOZ72070.1 FAD-binding protein [Bradyrhizobium arachidis]SFU85760.1 FAD/FMN-containing dehydrogenase [Bradyrhizobium arachidis]